MRPRRVIAAAMGLSLLLLAGAVLADGVDGRLMEMPQPDGSFVQMKVFGDELHARMETVDGYAGVRDAKSGWICFARLDPAGDNLLSTGVSVGDKPPVGLAKGLSISDAAARELRSARRAQLLGNEKDLLGHTPVTLGQVRGITLLVDFADTPGNPTWIPMIQDYLNLPGFNVNGNYGSVRDYFYTVSSKRLEYTNYLTPVFYRAPHPKSFYEASYGNVAALVVEVLDSMDAAGFDFSQYDSNGDGVIDAINMFYAGYRELDTALWPHFNYIAPHVYDGVAARYYQVTDLRAGPQLGTFCHENGHMIGAWPDLYDALYNSAGLGRFCLMAAGGVAHTPVAPNVWLRLEAGWVDPVVLDRHLGKVRLTTAYTNGALIPHPDPERTHEFYMIENRQATGLDQALPDPGGLAIYHVDLYGSQTNPGHYMVHLVQADGLRELERNLNQGGNGDLWHAPEYARFDFSTTPGAFWWDDAPIGLNVAKISAPGASMTFDFAAERIVIDVTPADLDAPWTLSGPSGFTAAGNGCFAGTVPRIGTYTLTWGGAPGWSMPVPAIVTRTVGLGIGEPTVFPGTYGAPFVATAVIGSGATVTGINVVDANGDGWDDVFVANGNAANLLLRNDGGSSFTDIATAPLSDAPATSAAVWADLNGDGEQDVFLASATGGNLLLEQVGGGYVDRTALTPGFATAGPIGAVSAIDYTREGRLDLHLIRYDSPDLLFTGNGGFAFNPGSAAFGLNGAQHTGAAWGNLNGDGWPDMFVGAAGDAAHTFGALAVNVSGVLTHPFGYFDWIGVEQTVDCAVVDINADGNEDVLALSRYGYLHIFQAGPSGSWQSYTAPGCFTEATAFTTADFDNNGLVDYYLVGGTTAGDCLALNRGDLNGDQEMDFEQVDLNDPVFAQPHTAVAAADFDRDGDIDLVVGAAGGDNLLVENRLSQVGNWLEIALVGTGGNRDALGAQITMLSGTTTQVRTITAGGGAGQDSKVAHFGAGDAATATVMVRWNPSSPLTVLANVPVNQRLVIEQDAPTKDAGDVTVAPSTYFAAPYPNPFNPSTNIALGLARAGHVRVAIYAIDGRRVAQLHDGAMAAGPHTLVWQGTDTNGHGVASGSYLCRIEADGQVHDSRLTLLK